QGDSYQREATAFLCQKPCRRLNRKFHRGGSRSHAPSQRSLACRHAGVVCGPNRANSFFLPEPIRSRFAWLIDIIPALSVRGASETTQAWHLHVSCRIVPTHPSPG